MDNMENTFIFKSGDIEAEVGDSKQKDFFPQVKIKKWDNDANFSIRFIGDGNSNDVRPYPENVLWKGNTTEALFYEKDNGIEFEIGLPKKPKSNKFNFSINSKNVEFFYQPSFINRVKQGLDVVPEGGRVTETVIYDRDDNIIAECPENVVGSYAVYHKTHIGDYSGAGGHNYGAGKIAHIYRPKATDKHGLSVWCDLRIENNNS